MARIIQERKYISITTTLPPMTVERIEALATHGKVSRAAIIRHVIHMGLEALHTTTKDTTPCHEPLPPISKSSLPQ